MFLGASVGPSMGPSAGFFIPRLAEPLSNEVLFRKLLSYYITSISSSEMYKGIYLYEEPTFKLLLEYFVHAIWSTL